MLSKGAKQKSLTVMPTTHSVGLLVGTSSIGDCEGAIVGDEVGDVVGDDVGDVVGDTVGEVVGDAVGEAVGDAVGEAVGDVLGELDGDCVGNEEGESVEAHSVQHSQPCSAQSTLKISNPFNLHKPPGNSPSKKLFPSVRVSKLFKSSRLSGTQPVKLLSFKASVAKYKRKKNGSQRSEFW